MTSNFIFISNLIVIVTYNNGEENKSWESNKIIQTIPEGDAHNILESTVRIYRSLNLFRIKIKAIL